MSFLAGVVLGWGAVALMRRLRADRASPDRGGPVYPPMDPDDQLGLLTGDCGPTAFRAVEHRCTDDCNPGNCPHEDF